MRRLAFMVLAAGLPVAGFAQDAVIRIEAKRGAEAAMAAAEGWSARFDDVVTFPLARGWVAIALGPQSPAEAEQRLAGLRAAGQVPGDSFVAVPGSDVTLSPVAAEAAPDAADADPVPAGPVDAVAVTPGPEEDRVGVAGVDEALPAEAEPGQAATDGEQVADGEPSAPAPGTHIRLQSLQSQAEAEAALDRWRGSFPEAGLWAMPGGWFGVTVGPMAPEAAQAWLAAFKASGDLPRDAFASDASELVRPLIAGDAPDWTAPGPVTEMPPLDAVQRALRWAGQYEGAIDGKTGPMTRDAIARQVAAMRVSPDPGTAMRSLIDSRAAWRDEMGLTRLDDAATGLSLIAPMDRLKFDRAERALSIYGPRDGSGAALILFSQPGGQQELLDLSGLVTALGWVPQPTRTIERGRVLLEGANDDHSGRAEGWVRDGRAEGFVLIWPADDPENQARIAADMSDSFARFAPAMNDGAGTAAAAAPAQP